MKKWKYAIVGFIGLIPLAILGLQTPFEPVAFIVGLGDISILFIIAINAYDVGKASGREYKPVHRLTVLKVITINLLTTTIVFLVYMLTFRQNDIGVEPQIDNIIFVIIAVSSCIYLLTY